MTLSEAIKEFKLGQWSYVAMHNSSDHRFYGCFVCDDRINEYLNMEIEDFKKLQRNIWTCKFPNYKEELGLDSLRLLAEKKKKADQLRLEKEEQHKRFKRK